MAQGIDIQSMLGQLASIEARPIEHPDAPLEVDGEPMSAHAWVQRASQCFDQAHGTPQERRDLKRGELSLQYRAEIAPEGDAENLIPRLEAAVEARKRSPKLYPGGNGQLTQLDRDQIAVACRQFPAFVQAMLDWSEHDKSWIDGFIKFNVRSPGAFGKAAPHWVAIFVLFPCEVDQLMDAALDKRFGATNPDGLRIEDGELQMLIDGTWHTIPVEKEQSMVTLRNRVHPVSRDPLELSWREMYGQFKAKRAGYFDVEVTELGVTNLNAIHIGSRNPQTGTIDEFDVTSKGWIRNLPVWRRASFADLRERYGDRLDWGNRQHHECYGIAICATRAHADRNVLETHGFFELIVPSDQEGEFLIYPFGFQPETLPDKDLEKLSRIQATHPCFRHYPDESVALTNRQMHAEFFPCSFEEYEKTEELLGLFRGVFQITGDNCAYHVINNIYDKIIGHRFYNAFEELAASIFQCTTNEIHPIMERMTRDLDGEARRKFVADFVGKLLAGATDQSKTGFALEDAIIDHERLPARTGIETLFKICFESLADSFGVQENIEGILERSLKNVQSILESKKSFLENKNYRAQLQQALEQLIHLTFESHQLYATSVWNLESTNWLIGGLLDIARMIPWEGLRNVLMRFVLFLFGSFRWGSYQEIDGTWTSKSVWNHPYHASKMQLPAELFYHREKMAQRKRELEGLFDVNQWLARGEVRFHVPHRQDAR